MSTQSSGNWFVRIEGTEYGPYTESNLKNWASQGNLPFDAEVRKGNGPWVQASKVVGLIPKTVQPDSSNPATNNRLAEIEAAIKGKHAGSSRQPTSNQGKRSKNSGLTWWIAGGSVILLLGASFFYWYNLPKNKEQRAEAKIAQGFRELAEANHQRSRESKPAEPEPLRILRAEYSNGFIENVRLKTDDASFNITVSLKNESKGQALDRVTYYTRTIKPGRKIREFDTLTPDESIRGGINPGEVIEHKFSVACYKLNGNEALLHQLPPDTVLEVSTDKIIWIPVRFVGQERQLPGVSRQNDDLLKGGF